MQRIETDLRLVRAGNASPMTHAGTNTWLVGRDRVAVIDPGPDDDAHLAALLAALDGAAVAGILVTHAHRDHSALAPRLAAATGAPVLASGPAGTGRREVMRALADAGAADGGEGVDASFAPDVALAEGDSLQTDAGTVTALETPGHMAGHLSFDWAGALFSGDLVMGWASTLISPPDGDVTAYMRSLARLARHDHRRYYPGHGPAVAHPAQRLAELTAHRHARRKAVAAALAAGACSVEAIAERIYTDLPDAMLPMARRNVLAHLIELWEHCEAIADPSPGTRAVWTPPPG